MPSDLSIPLDVTAGGQPATAWRYIRTSHPVSQKAARLAVKRRMKKVVE